MSPYMRKHVCIMYVYIYIYICLNICVYVRMYAWMYERTLQTNIYVCHLAIGLISLCYMDNQFTWK